MTVSMAIQKSQRHSSVAGASPYDPGQKLRQVRERLRLRYRDVEEWSQRIGNQRGNHEFIIGLSRLADIENKGTLPSVYRLYSLCAIYGLDFNTVLGWYGIDLQELPAEAATLALSQTHPIDFECPPHAEVKFPAGMGSGFDFRRTAYLTRQIERWGKLPLSLLNSLDFKRQRYGFIGADDWSMYPIIAPGSFVQIDESRRKIASEGWANEYERPIYFLEHRKGFCCGWCSDKAGFLIVRPHPASYVDPEIFKYPGDADIIGQVVAVAMRLDLGKRRHTRSSAAPR